MGKLLKWQNDKIASSKNAILMRLAVDKMGILLNCCLTKYQVDETSSRLNSKKERLTKWDIDIIVSWQNYKLI